MIHLGFPSGSAVKNSPAIQEPQGTRVQSPGQEDPLEEDTATHSSILAWRIPWTEEPDGLQSMRSQRVRHDWSDLACIIHLVHSEGAFKKKYFMTLKGINHSPKEKKKLGKSADTTDTAFYEISWEVITDWRAAHRLGEIPATTARTSDPQNQPSPTKCRLCCPQGFNHLWGLESMDSVCVCAQSCPTLFGLLDCNLPGSSVHGIF